MAEREHWKNRSTFIMATIGSAIGLGNLWRFPYIATQNGGGAFLIPFFFALVTAGIPIMIIEYGIGVRSQASADIAFGKISPGLRYIGWLAIMGAFIINIYYCVVMGWSLKYLFDAGSIAQWGKDIASSKAHFFVDTLAVSDHPFNFGGIRWPLFAGLLATWISMWHIVRGGLGRVGKVLNYSVPLPVILITILVVRGLTLPGATAGLNYYLAPDWGKLAEGKVWLAAYGQIFFSLSVGFGTMITYASFMPKDTEIPNSASITSFADCAFSFLAGFAVFSVLGYFAVASNLPVDKVSGEGPGLAFIVYPTALATLPVWVRAFAAVFFLTLISLGIDSAFSLLETVATALSDKFGMTRERATTLVAVVSFLLGIPFVTRAGILWLDIVDHFLLSYLITFVGIAECVIVAYFLGVKKFSEEINKNAEIKLGRTFGLMVGVVTPAVLTISFVTSLIQEFKTPYGGYPVSALIILGGGSLLIVIVGAFILGSSNLKNNSERI